jgi:Tfp pilus assembly protein PilN
MIRINLLPKEERGKSGRKVNWAQMSVFLLLASIILMSLFTVFNYMLLTSYRERLANVQPEMATLRAAEREMQKLESANNEIRKSVQVGEQLFVRSANDSVLELIQRIAQVTPPNIWLRQLQLNAGNTLAINGYATQAADISLYLSDLQNVSSLSNIQINALSRIGDGTQGIRVFGLHITLQPGGGLK